MSDYTLQEALGEFLTGDNSKRSLSSHTLGEAATIKILRNLQKRYAETAVKCPFVPGDLVTPMEHTNLVGAGEPCIVIDVLDVPKWSFSGEATNTAYGRRMDIRILRVGESADTYDVIPFWAESWAYEPYVLKAERDEAEEA